MLDYSVNKFVQRDSRWFFQINIRRVNSINAQYKIRLDTFWKLIMHFRKVSDLRSKEILLRVT